MNLILLEPDDFVAVDKARISGRRREHVLSVHRATPGAQLRVGVLGGLLGRGLLESIDDQAIEMRVELDQHPPTPSPVWLAVAMSRPPTLRKVLRYATSMGVKRFLFFHSKRVEKS